MQPAPVLHRASALAAGVVAVVLLVCGALFTHPMPDHTGAMDTGGSRADTRVVEAHAPAGSDGGCSAAGRDCPLASAQAPTPGAGPADGVSTVRAWAPRAQTPGTAGPAAHLVCVRPRAPDLASLCVSRT